MDEPSKDSERIEEFSIVDGGPSYRLLLHARLIDPARASLRREVLAFVAIAWAPLAVLSLFVGTFSGGVDVPFLYDLSNLRFLVSAPLLILAEAVAHRRIKGVVNAFLSHDLIGPKERGRFDSIIASTLRLRNSNLVELALFVLSYTVGFWLWQTYGTLSVSNWYATTGDEGLRFNAAGQWMAWVSSPITRFLLLRWYFRLGIWYVFLWRVARLPLRLNPLHPDGAGGLGFLEQSVPALAPMLVAQSSALALMIGNQILHEGAVLTDFELELAGFVAWLVLLVLAPMTFFVFQMVEAKLHATREYGRLASRYTNEFERKWLRPGDGGGEPLLGTSDIQSLADLGGSFSVVREMRVLPFDRALVLRLAITIALPFAPLVLTMTPLEELVHRILRLVV